MRLAAFTTPDLPGAEISSPSALATLRSLVQAEIDRSLDFIVAYLNVPPPPGTVTAGEIIAVMDNFINLVGYKQLTGRLLPDLQTELDKSVQSMPTVFSTLIIRASADPIRTVLGWIDQKTQALAGRQAQIDQEIARATEALRSFTTKLFGEAGTDQTLIALAQQVWLSVQRDFESVVSGLFEERNQIDAAIGDLQFMAERFRQEFGISRYVGLGVAQGVPGQEQIAVWFRSLGGLVQIGIVIVVALVLTKLAQGVLSAFNFSSSDAALNNLILKLSQAQQECSLLAASIKTERDAARASGDTAAAARLQDQLTRSLAICKTIETAKGDAERAKRSPIEQFIQVVSIGALAVGGIMLASMFMSKKK